MKNKNKNIKYFKKLYLYSTLFIIAVCIYGYSFLSNLYSEESINKDDEQNTLKDIEDSKQPTDILVDNCNDGDTCTVQVLGLRFHVRLAEIDAPEIAKKKGEQSQPFSKQAKDRLNQLVQNKYVHLHQISLDKYNRPIVEMVVVSSGENVNLTLLEEGLAELYTGGRKNTPKDPKYIQAQIKAKKQKLGIWSLKDYVSPYEYRRLKSRSN